MYIFCNHYSVMLNLLASSTPVELNSLVLFVQVRYSIGRCILYLDIYSDTYSRRRLCRMYLYEYWYLVHVSVYSMFSTVPAETLCRALFNNAQGMDNNSNITSSP